MNKDCPFCEIIEGKSLAKIVYEDHDTIAFLDKSNDVYGHTLVIPRAHIDNLMDCDTLILNRIMVTVKKVADFYINYCGFSGINLLNANGISAEQSIPHFHIHLIPRVKADEYTAWPNFPKNQRNFEEEYKRLKLSNS